MNIQENRIEYTRHISRNTINKEENIMGFFSLAFKQVTFYYQCTTLYINSFSGCRMPKPPSNGL
jgi:hypothetical protein